MKTRCTIILCDIQQVFQKDQSELPADAVGTAQLRIAVLITNKRCCRSLQRTAQPGDLRFSLVLLVHCKLCER